MEPKIVKKGPYMMEMQPGTYHWCSCGHSAKDPFCDGAHEKLGTDMKPVEVSISYPKTVAWCGCKHSGKPPYCDGAHNKLKP
ncbi:MAG: CDGSH iron-sulfur domain-containing protein [Deltaproteobacteria bacterium]|nr:CDGSH iron-sulfur domain-containing protein [Deltaproteobacteria bacterium]